MTSLSWIWRFQHLKILGKLYSSHVLCPNVAIFLKYVFIFKDRTLKKNNIERTRISMWFGRENNENVVRTRDWCGWPSSPHQTKVDICISLNRYLEVASFSKSDFPLMYAITEFLFISRDKQMWIHFLTKSGKF